VSHRKPIFVVAFRGVSSDFSVPLEKLILPVNPPVSESKTAVKVLATGFFDLSDRVGPA